tara:strand:+ start:121 stop:771 length:651 start_codon:yes stop_codon:yes gene_type:complete
MNNIKLGCGGSNPKIITMNKQKIQLEGEYKIFLLLDNNDGFRIIAKCKKLSEKSRESILNKYRSNNSGKVKNYTNILMNEVYLKLISIEYNNEILIIDMNDLKEKEIVSIDYLDNLDLENLEGIKYNHINISKVKNSPIGLFINGKNIKSYKTIDRVIKIKLKNNDLTIRLAKDKRNLILRNSIEIEYTNFEDLINFSGILLRKDNYYLDKIEELK